MTLKFPEPIRNLPRAHTHEDQGGFLLDGEIEPTIGDGEHLYRKGDNYHVPENVPHSAKISAG